MDNSLHCLQVVKMTQACEGKRKEILGNGDGPFPTELKVLVEQKNRIEKSVGFAILKALIFNGSDP